MPKIKLLLTSDTSSYYDDEYNHTRWYEDISDWEEVSDEDYSFIRFNLYRLKPPSGLRYVLVQQDAVSVYERINGIKAAIKKEEEQEAKRRAEYLKKKEAAAAERAAKKAEKAAKAAEKKLLADKEALLKLMEENPELLKKVLSS